MLLTKESDYGIRVIRALASSEKKTVKEICDAEFVPHQYAYKILKKLENAGILQSIRGRDGGYRLAKPMSGFTLYDIVTALDENSLIFECLRDDNTCVFKTASKPCSVHDEFKRLQKRLISEMNNVTMDKVII